MAQDQLTPVASARPWACNVVLLVTDGGSDIKSARKQAVFDIRAAVPGVKFCVVSIRQDDETAAQKENRCNEIDDFIGANGQNLNANGFADLDGLVEATMECICCPCIPCQADTVIVVDRTGSIGTSGTFNYIRQFVKDLLDTLYSDPAEYDVKTALISFSNFAQLEYGLDSAAATDLALAKDEVDGIPGPKGQTNTHLALQAALAQFNDFARAGFKKRLVLITDGGSDVKSATTEAANKLNDLDGFRMCVLSIRKDEIPGSTKYENRDKEIARLIDGDGVNVNAGDFTDLAGLVQDIVDCVCG
jgi:hypothetical protein